MKIRTALLSLPLLAGGVLTARTTLQDGMPIVKPEPQHDVLKQMAGTWSAVIDFGGEQEAGTLTRKLGMNGLWVVADFEGQMMGGPFLGHEVMGWDAQKKKYVSCWVDSMNTALTLLEGAWDETTKTMTMESLQPDPMTGANMVNVTKVQDADHHVFTMHMGSAETPPMMTITYTRKE